MHKVNLESVLRVITPDEPGILGRIMGTLANAGVDLKAINARSDKTRGRFILLTSNNQKASKALKALGYKVEKEEVVTAVIDDRVGAGAEIGALLANAIIDVDYCFGSSSGMGKALLVVRTNDNKKAYSTLR